MTVEEMRKCKEDNGFSYDQISEQSGVPASTIFKIFTGLSRSPRKRTLDAIEAGLRKLAGPQMENYLRCRPHTYRPYVAENAVQYGLDDGSLLQRNSRLYITNPDGSHTWLRQGYYTIEDYDSLPEEIHAEFVDGYIIEMEAPSLFHQTCIGFLFRKISDHIEDHDLGCQAFTAPFYVMLNKNDKVVLEPDLGVVCDDSLLSRYGVTGAPDFVAEILSKTTKRRDMTEKAGMYARAGVKLYWMIDPDREQVIIHDFQTGDELSIHTFDETVALKLHGQELDIDFTQLRKQLTKLQEKIDRNKEPASD